MPSTRAELIAAVKACYAPAPGDARSIEALADAIAMHHARVRPRLVAAMAAFLAALAIAYIAAPALIRTELMATIVTASIAAFTFLKVHIPRLGRDTIEAAAKRGDPRPPHGLVVARLIDLGNREVEVFERYVPLFGALIVAITALAKLFGWS
ncbi:MAG: hypothetical protein ACK4MF_02765 [Hyphomicrobiaceae bacterium]